MAPTRPSAPAVHLFGAVNADQLNALGVCMADARQQAQAQAAAVNRIRAVYGMCFSNSVN